MISQSDCLQILSMISRSCQYISHCQIRELIPLRQLMSHRTNAMKATVEACDIQTVRVSNPPDNQGRFDYFRFGIWDRNQSGPRSHIEIHYFLWPTNWIFWLSVPKSQVPTRTTPCPSSHVRLNSDHVTWCVCVSLFLYHFLGILVPKNKMKNEKLNIWHCYFNEVWFQRFESPTVRWIAAINASRHRLDRILGIKADYPFRNVLERSSLTSFNRNRSVNILSLKLEMVMHIFLVAVAKAV